MVLVWQATARNGSLEAERKEVKGRVEWPAVAEPVDRCHCARLCDGRAGRVLPGSRSGTAWAATNRSAIAAVVQVGRGVKSVLVMPKEAWILSGKERVLRPAAGD